MKYTTQLIALAGVASAFPHPQFPGFSMPSFSMPTGGFGSGTGTGLGSGLGGGAGIPSMPVATDMPSVGSGTGSGSSWSDWLGGFGGGAAATSAAQPTATATKTGGVAVPTGGNTGGSGTIGSDCKAQGSGGGSTENGVVDKNCCTDMTVIFARGTGEMGNMGSVSGPPMVKAIRSKLGADRVTVQGVEYPASAGGNANMGGDGGAKMATLVNTALTQCPSTKVIVSGYSQGAMVVHNAFTAGKLTSSKVSGAVLFGDPMKRQSVGDLPTNKVKEFCGTSDQICGGGGDGGATGSHLSYGSSADVAATFAIQAAGLA